LGANKTLRIFYGPGCVLLCFYLLLTNLKVMHTKMQSYLLFCVGLRIAVCLGDIETFYEGTERLTDVKQENDAKIKK
jgi:hypothetical protein